MVTLIHHTCTCRGLQYILSVLPICICMYMYNLMSNAGPLYSKLSLCCTCNALLHQLTSTVYTCNRFFNSMPFENVIILYSFINLLLLHEKSGLFRSLFSLPIGQYKQENADELKLVEEEDDG